MGAAGSVIRGGVSAEIGRDIVLQPEAWLLGDSFSRRENFQMRISTSKKIHFSIPTWIQLIGALAILVFGLGCQPKDVRPGLWLSGDLIETDINDWSFTNEFEEIFIQTSTWYLLPHSTTIWGAEMGRGFFIGSYGYGEGDEDKKHWENNIARNPEARIRIDGKLYDVTVEPVTSKRLSVQLETRYNEKYDMEDTFGEDLPKWWFYRVTQRD